MTITEITSYIFPFADGGYEEAQKTKQEIEESGKGYVCDMHAWMDTVVVTASRVIELESPALEVIDGIAQV